MAMDTILRTQTIPWLKFRDKITSEIKNTNGLNPFVSALTVSCPLGWAKRGVYFTQNLAKIFGPRYGVPNNMQFLFWVEGTAINSHFRVRIDGYRTGGTMDRIACLSIVLGSMTLSCRPYVEVPAHGAVRTGPAVIYNVESCLFADKIGIVSDYGHSLTAMGADADNGKAVLLLGDLKGFTNLAINPASTDTLTYSVGDTAPTYMGVAVTGW